MIIIIIEFKKKSLKTNYNYIIIDLFPFPFLDSPLLLDTSGVQEHNIHSEVQEEVELAP